MELLESRFTTPSPAKRTIPSSQEATLNPNSPGGSHHSYGFDTPSTPSTTRSPAGTASSSSQSPVSKLDQTLIRSKRKSKRRSTLSMVEMAAAKHMRKVGMRSSPLSFSSVSGLPSPQVSNQSNQTVPTGHISSNTQQHHQHSAASTPTTPGGVTVTPRIVSESPPPKRTKNNNSTDPVVVMTVEATPTSNPANFSEATTPAPPTTLPLVKSSVRTEPPA